jgi:peptidoglycan/LPS O-acetylase OafA/YrhL
LLRHSSSGLLPAPFLYEIAFVGPIGVGFFFVLSGFLLTLTWSPNTSSRKFLLRRGSRILPLHFLTSALAIIQLALKGTPHWVSSFLSLLLVQSWLPDTFRLGGNGVSWSLSVEMFFYLMFPLVIKRLTLLRLKALPIHLVATFVIMGSWILGYGVAESNVNDFISAFSPYTNPLYRFGEFYIGCIIAVAFRQGWRPKWGVRTGAIIAVALYFALAGINAFFLSHSSSLGFESGFPLSVLDFMFLPATAFLVAGAAHSDLIGDKNLLSSRWIVRFGKWSFALYLIQMIIVDFLSRFSTASRLETTDLFLFLTALSASMAASAVLHYLVEQPAEKYLRRQLKIM